ncbi:MAG: terpene cyclase/mutase family protein [Planctomycetes bacterium]|nr:terpene cyclase/mutase family protein [Planctomycetota bacterium]
MDEPSHEPLETATPRKKRDWTTPVLLTVSVHLMAFTLLVNHRLFELLTDPKPGVAVLSIAGIIGDDPRHKPETDSGAAPGPKAETIGPSITDLVREEPVQPRASQPSPDLQPRDKPAESTPTVQPRNLGQRLREAASEGGGGALPGEMSVRPAGGGGSHGLRGRGNHGVGLNRNGGSSETENAVELGLAWLSSVQDADGRWDSDGYMVHYLPNTNPESKYAEGQGLTNLDVGMTALCMLAFTGAGYTDETDRYRNTVANARAFLLSRQRAEDGGFGERTGSRPTMYDHALATLAICDLYMTSGDIKLLNPIQRAVRYMLSLQQPLGGWTYDQSLPSDARFSLSARNDLSISGWCIMALVCAREAGVNVPDENLRRCAKFLKEFTRADGEALYADKSPREGERGLAMLAVSSACRRLLGESGDTATQGKQMARIANTPPQYAKAGDLSESMYMWYYASIAMLLAKSDSGGENRWRNWNIALKRALVDNQCKEGGRRGSFDPVCFWAKTSGGRLYSTAIAVLNLEIYYRYDPAYLRAAGTDFSDLWK